MRRRDVIATLACVAAMPQYIAHAEQGKIYKIGFLGSTSEEGYSSQVAGLRRGLAEQGLIENKNLEILFRWAHDDYKKLPVLARELVAAGVDLIITHGTPGPFAARDATKSIPILFMGGADPVAIGLVHSLSKPGENVTGIAYFYRELCVKRVEFLKEIIPGARHIGVILNPNNDSAQPAYQEMISASRSIGVEISSLPVVTARDVESVFSVAKSRSLDALTVIDDGIINSMPRHLGELAITARMPFASGFRESVTSGAVLSYGVDFPELFRTLAVFARQCLVDGRNPKDIPILRAIKFPLVISVRSADVLGIRVPASLLGRAEEIVD